MARSRLPWQHWITNESRAHPVVVPEDIRERIGEALRRMADVEANRINIETQAGNVILEGTVGSQDAHDTALAAVYATPGISAVEDRLVVRGLD